MVQWKNGNKIKVKVRCNAFEITNKNKKEISVDMVESDCESWVEILDSTTKTDTNETNEISCHNMEDNDSENDDEGHAIDKWNKTAEEELRRILGVGSK